MAAKTQHKSLPSARKEAELVALSTAKVMIKGSVPKLNRALSVIRGTRLGEAMNYLYFCGFACGQPLAKLLKSAAANAFDRGLIKDLDQLYIVQIWAVKGMELRRMRAASRGRGSPRRKSYSQVFVSLGMPSGI